MNEVIQLLKELNFPTILAIIGATWWFNRSSKKDFKAWKEEVKNEILEIKKDSEEFRTELRSIHKDLKFYNIRLARTEGTVYGKDIYKQDKDGN